MMSNHSEQDLSSNDEACNSEELRQIHQQPEQGKDDIVQGSDQEEGERSDIDQTSCDIQQQSEETIAQGIDQEEGERSDSDESSCDVQEQSEEIYPAIGSGDFGRAVKLKAQRPLTDSEKLYVLENHFVPGKDYQFQSRVFAG